jgi:hypothetical protein
VRGLSFGAIAVAASVVTAGLTACDSCSKSSPDKATTETPTTAAPSNAASAPSAIASAAAPAEGGHADGAKHDMGNCPTAVTGADVAIKDVDGGVEVAVTGQDDTMASEIRTRMKKLAEQARVDAGGAKHDHSGSGGGTTGRCTIIMRNTNLVTADIPKGSKVTVTPTDKSELDWLRRETKERDKEAKATGSEGAGVKRMANCPSAVEGAKTAVKDAKDGVVVTVTGPNDKVEEIRSRAKHAAEVGAKAEGSHVEHSGGGTGGGGLGHCPIVVEGDTKVAVKDVTGGVEVTVTTKADVAALQKEATLRAGNFPK